VSTTTRGGRGGGNNGFGAAANGGRVVKFDDRRVRPTPADSLAPADPDIETAVIGSLVIASGDHLPEISRFLRVRDFTRPMWAAAYKVLLDMYDDGTPIDYVSTVSRLDEAVRRGAVPHVGHDYPVEAELTRAIEGAGMCVHVVHYARRVRELATRRVTIEAAQRIARMAFDPTERAARTIAHARSLIDDLDRDTAESQSGDVHEALAGLVDSRPRSWSTGIGLLDYWLAGGLVTGRMLAISGDTGVGKAQPLTAKVLTPTGWRLMGELRPGDLVIGASGKGTRVAAVYPQGEQDVWELTFSDGARARCTRDHLWQVRTQNQKHRGAGWTVKCLGDILDGPFVLPGHAKYYIPMVGPVEFSTGELPVDPYVLGVLLGDAHLRQRETGSEILLSTPDAEILSAVLDRLPGIEARASGRYDYRLVAPARRSTNWLTSALRELGLMGKMSHEKAVPSVYLVASAEQRLELLRGLMDTDGTVSRSSGTPSFSTSSRQLADDVLFLVRSLGGRARIATKRTTHRDSYRLNLSLPRGIQPFRLERKARLANIERPKYEPTRALMGAEWVGREASQCIAVEAEDGLYVTDDFVVTHNTWLATRLMIAAMEAGARCADFSLEMTKEQRVVRYAACLHGRRANRLLVDPSKWTDDDRAVFGQAGDWLLARDLRIYDRVSAAADIEAKVRQHGFEIVLVDYYGNLDDPEGGETEVQADRANSRILEQTARRSGACVIVVAQRNEADRNLHFGQHLKRRCDASIKLAQPDDTPSGQMPIVELIMEKNRWEADAKAGGRGRFRMDKTSGQFSPIYDGRTEQ